MMTNRQLIVGILSVLSLGHTALLSDSALSKELGQSPSPANKAGDVAIDTILSWAPGALAVSYDVYFGTVFADVNNATRNNPLAVLLSRGQTTTTFDPPGLLAYGQTYYWRVNEVSASASATLYKGTAWSFTAEPYAYPLKPISATASSSQADMGPEKTIDGSGLDPNDQHGTDPYTMWLGLGPQPIWIQYEFDKVYKLYELKVWNSNRADESLSGFGARKVTIGYSTDGITWRVLDNVPEFAQAPGKAGYTANTTVRFGGVMARYVRLVIDSTWSDLTGIADLSEVRFSYIPVQAFGPQPVDGATDVSVDPTLSWRPGREAASHDVFLGTDYAAVFSSAVAGASSADHSLAPDNLSFGGTYYWKVDEVNAVSYGGAVWSFTTQEYALVDDFESYNDTDNRIFNTWIDGRTDGRSGSVVSYSTAADNQPNEVPLTYTGQQAMALEYNNVKAPYYSEVSRTFDTPQDWTVHGADTLRLYYRGYRAGFIDKGNNAFTIGSTSSDYDIGGGADEFRFVYKQLSGDGSLTMKVDRFGAAAKAGPMIRESLDAVSRNACCLVSTSHGVFFQWRETTGGLTPYYQTSGPAAPYWVRLTRTGDVFKGERSLDGLTWTQQGMDATVAMGPDVYIGMAVSNDHTWYGTTAQISNISTTGAVTGSWQKFGTDLTPWTDDPATWSNDPAPLYLMVEDMAGRSKMVVASEDTTRDSWLSAWTISLSNLSSAGINPSAVEKLTIGIGDKANPKPGGGIGMVYIDDIGFGHPMPAGVERGGGSGGTVVRPVR